MVVIVASAERERRFRLPVELVNLTVIDCNESWCVPATDSKLDWKTFLTFCAAVKYSVL